MICFGGDTLQNTTFMVDALNSVGNVELVEEEGGRREETKGGRESREVNSERYKWNYGSY